MNQWVVGKHGAYLGLTGMGHLRFAVRYATFEAACEAAEAKQLACYTLSAARKREGL